MRESEIKPKVLYQRESEVKAEVLYQRESQIKDKVLNQLEPSTSRDQLENDVVVEVFKICLTKQKSIFSCRWLPSFITESYIIYVRLAVVPNILSL